MRHREGGFVQGIAVMSIFRLFPILAAFLIAPAAHAADDSIKIGPGASVQLAVSESPLIDESVALKGKVSVTPPGEAGGKYVLTYRAPPDGIPFKDVVKFKDGDVEHSKIVDVAGAQPPTPPAFEGEVYAKSFKALFVLFILATLLESGLAVIFGWRPFLVLFNARGMKTIVSVGLAYLTVSTFRIDVLTGLINIYTGSAFPVGFLGMALSALVIAGGSSGVNNVLTTLGFRSIKTVEQAIPTPPPDKAWISIRLVRSKVVGPVFVVLTVGAEESVIGDILGTSRLPAAVRFFIRDPGRFPTYGGYAVAPGNLYRLALRGLVDGKEQTMLYPIDLRLAAGAIVDIDMKF